jgi:hypothetical protein
MQRQDKRQGERGGTSELKDKTVHCIRDDLQFGAQDFSQKGSAGWTNVLQ